MDAVGPGQQGQVEALVHQEADVGLPAELADRLGPGQDLPVGRVLGAQLHHRGAARAGRAGLVDGRVLPAGMIVGQDVDVAQEMTEFVRQQILSQSAIAMLAQANSLPRLAMQLLGG